MTNTHARYRLSLIAQGDRAKLYKGIFVCSACVRLKLSWRQQGKFGQRSGQRGEHMVLGTTNLKLWVDTLSLTAERAPQFIDITENVQECVRRAGIVQGMALIFSKHTTAAIKINEHEPELLKDMEDFLSRLSPTDAGYFHNNFEVRTVNMEEDECPNGHAHCQHLLLSSSETVPISDGRLDLGVWQRIFLVELDRPRPRQVMVQVLGG